MMPTSNPVGSSSKQDTRQLLLEAGAIVMLEKGYTNSGISEILLEARVPKGSFYHYFTSKEDFALAIIASTSDKYAARMEKVFGNTDVSAAERLKDYFLQKRDEMADRDCRQGWLIGNLSQEMADQSEALRAALTEVLYRSKDVLASCIAEAQANEEFHNPRDPGELSELVLAAWTGAMLVAKTQKSCNPLNTCIRLVFEDLLLYREFSM